MEGKATYLKKRLNLFIKVVQYISGLTGSQNIWTETSKIVVNRLKADVVGFAWTGPNKRIITDYWTFSNKISIEKILTLRINFCA